MAQSGARPTLVALVFDPSSGRVSVNGKRWVQFRVGQRGAKPVKPESRKEDRKEEKDDKEEKRRKASEFPPPGDGDDTLACLFCDHAACHLCVFDGEAWVDLGVPCNGPFCS